MMTLSITLSPFGTDLIGRQMTLYTMTNVHGASVSVLDFGAHLVSVRVPDKNGEIRDVVLGYDTLAEYDQGPSYLGATVGRYANRIGHAAFTLNGQEYTLFKNDGDNSLHGGREGFDKKWFRGETLEDAQEDTVIFTYVAHDGEEGYPGKMHLQVAFSWDNANTLTIRYMAQADKDTVINLTNHAYFNLAGQGIGNVLGHELTLHAEEMTEVDEALIPTGAMVPLKGTVLDFSAPKTLQQVLDEGGACPPVRQVNGLDFNFCIPGTGMRECAMLRDPESGRTMTVVTDQPGIQVYSGQGLNVTGKGGVHYGAFAGIALETQHYPDSPNHPAFPSTLLMAGDTFMSTTQYAFMVE
ncbi:MAG: galactose mutarotase [Clostridiales bacterium]|nr:galactose mutarotase [Clostridiales bacterium]